MYLIPTSLRSSEILGIRRINRDSRNMGNRPALDILVSAGTSDQQDVGNVYGATDGESRPTSCGSRLSVYLVTGEFGIPTVYKPDVVIRELRKLFK